MPLTRILLRLAIFGAMAALAALVPRGMSLLPESAAVARGAANANVADCIACHGQPGSVLPDDAAIDCAYLRNNTTHPGYEGRCNDLLAYFEVVRLKRSFESRARNSNPNRLLQGERLARQYNCFLCHGELGQGGFRNAGALKGYIPGYFGNDFAQLTRSGSVESIRAWISQGIDPTIFEKPIEGTIARFFVERQDVGMPNFGTLSDSKIQILTDYVISLNQFGEMDAADIRAYSQLTQRRLLSKIPAE